MAARLRMFLVPRFLNSGCAAWGASTAVSMIAGCLLARHAKIGRRWLLELYQA